MNWISISIVAYLLIALQAILDKFMLSSKRVEHPATFAFYTGVLSFFTLFLFLPFGSIHLVSPAYLLSLLSSGMIFIFGVVFIFFAIQKNQASQVVPVAGAVTPIVTYLLSAILQSEKLDAANIFGTVLLIFGGLLISFDLPLRITGRKFFRGFYYSISGGFLLGIALFIFKIMYDADNFSNVFVWTRMGFFAGALTFLFVPAWRKAILASFKNFQKNKKDNSKTGALFVFNKILGGSGSLLMNYAISLGSVTIVNALVATEYVFVMAIGIVFSIWHSKVFQESKKFWDIAQKVAAISIISAGVLLISK